MSLDQAIKHGKEKRKPYYETKAIDAWCRNHSLCVVCRKNRMHKRRIEELRAKDKEKSSDY